MAVSKFIIGIPRHLAPALDDLAVHQGGIRLPRYVSQQAVQNNVGFAAAEDPAEIIQLAVRGQQIQALQIRLKHIGLHMTVGAPITDIHQRDRTRGAATHC
ncbi:hypothetical protein [Pseudomonas baltica]|uniref:hypothetical protein n=1 Tax=Pseudomonas baltica TaxID=2762576 RepID=UPI0028A185FB|nr:hypothetical protein [Pseudomonas baltica]